MKIEGSVFLITGGANGIGKEISKRMLEKGAKFVAILDCNEASGKQTEEEFAETFGANKANFFLCDVSKEDQLSASFENAFKVHEQLDVVINNAGIAREEEITIAINLVAVIRGSYLARKYMSKKNGGNGGVLINVGSIAGIFPAGLAIYAASKYGVVGFTLSLPVSDLAFSLNDIRVATVCPYFVDTQVGDDVLKFLPAHMKGKVNKDTVNYIKSSLVVDAYVMIVEDESIHAKVLRVTPAKGIDFHPLPTAKELTQEFGYLKLPQQ